MAKNSPQIERLLTIQTEPLGWIGIVHRGEVIRQVKFGFASHAALVREFNNSVVLVHDPNEFENRLLDTFEAYALGDKSEINQLSVDESWMTPFQRKVSRTCRRIPYGKTLSYGQLAAKSGSPRAARAVGTVMSSNRFPLIVPCHRVVSSSGLGGFSSPRGIDMKKRLLQLESGELLATR